MIRRGRPGRGGAAAGPAVLEDGDQHAERCGGGEQVHHRRDRGDQQAAESQQQQQEPEDEDDRDEDQQLGRDHGGEVAVDGGDAADVDAQHGAAFGGGDHCGAQPVDEGAGGRGLGGGSGYHADQRGALAGDGRGDGGDPGLGLERAGQPGERGSAGGGAGDGDELQRAVEAGTESGGEQFVGLVGGGGGGVVGRVGGAQPQREHRDGQDEHDGRGRGGQRGGVALHEGGQPRPPAGCAIRQLSTIGSPTVDDRAI